MNNYPILSVYALSSKAKTNKELLIMAGIGIIVIGGLCYYYYIQNQELKQIQQTHSGQMSEINSRVSSLQESNRGLQYELDKIYQRSYELMATINKFESMYKKEEGSPS
jgi:Tfp pilus assembly major pilin PilA